MQIERNVFSEIVFLVLQFNTVNLGFDVTSAENWFPFKDIRCTRPILFVQSHRDKRETSALSSAFCQGFVPVLVLLFFSFFLLLLLPRRFTQGNCYTAEWPAKNFGHKLTPVCLPGGTIRSAIKGRTRGSVNISELSKSASSPLSKASRDFNRTEQSRAHPSYIYEIDIKHRVLQPQPLSVPEPPTIRLHLYLCMTQKLHTPARLLSIDARNSSLYFTPRYVLQSLLVIHTFLCYEITRSVVTQLLIFRAFLTLLLWFFTFWNLRNCGYPECQPFENEFNVESNRI